MDEDFYVPASDTKGHSERIWCRIIPGLARQMEEIIQARKFPYKTVSDMIRHAIRRHLVWLNEQDPTPSVTMCVGAIIEIMRQEEEGKEFQAVIERICKGVEYHLNAKAEVEAVKLVLRVVAQMEAMPDGYWKDRYKTEVEKKFGWLLKDTNKAKLRGGE